jgi:hypothetical protein
MKNTINTIGKKLSKGVAKSMLATAAAAALSLVATSNSAYGALADVTAIQTQFTAGKGTTVTNVSGYGDTSTGFLPGNTYTIHYAGGDLAVTKLHTNGQDYVPFAQGTAVVRRNSVDPNTDILWYATSGNINTANGSTLNLEGPQLAGYNAALSTNNLLVGADNIFGNVGNGHGNNTNVERIDLLYTAGVTTAADKLFAVFERGLTGAHDGFKIAAITSLDSSNVPNGYGTLINVAKGSYGNTPLLAAQGYTILRTNDNIAGDPFHPADKTTQTIGGISIPTTDLAAPGTTIYGYSLFAPDQTGSGAQLVNWTNSTFFPTNSREGTIAGLDPQAASGTLYAAIPEPTTGSLMVAGAGLLLGRRSKRRQTKA